MSRRLPLLLFLFIACLLPLAALATADNSRFQEANAAYSRNDFNSAINNYEELLREQGYSPGVLYNLANSYAQTGKIGKAVLNYERALKLDPNDPDTIGNLQLVRTTHGLFTQEATLSERFLRLLNMNQWITLAGLALAALTCALLASLWIRISRRALVIFSLSCLATIMAGVINTVALRQEWAGSVVIHESRLQISPFEGAASAGNIQEGRMVYLKKEHGGYIYVEDETGRKGWLQLSAVEPVIPAKE